MSPLTLIIEASTRASTTASSFRTPHSLNHPLCTWVSSFNILVSCIAVLLYQEKKLIYVLNLSHCISLFPTKDYQPLTPPMLLQLPSTRPLATSYLITLALGTQKKPVQYTVVAKALICKQSSNQSSGNFSSDSSSVAKQARNQASTHTWFLLSTSSPAPRFLPRPPALTSLVHPHLPWPHPVR